MAFHMTADAEQKLRAVAKWITEDARRINIEQWQTRYHGAEEDTPQCGTVCCIAGWLELFDRVEDLKPEVIKTTPLLNKLSNNPYSDSVPARAAQILGAEYTWDVENLFYPDQWDRDLREELDLTEPRTRDHAAVVVKAIERFISSPETFGYNQDDEEEEDISYCEECGEECDDFNGLCDYCRDEEDEDEEDILDESKAEAEAKLD